MVACTFTNNSWNSEVHALYCKAQDCLGDLTHAHYFHFPANIFNYAATKYKVVQ